MSHEREALDRLTDVVLIVVRLLENQERLLRRIEKLIDHQRTYPAPTSIKFKAIP
jgi:hypothetical protein